MDWRPTDVEKQVESTFGFRDAVPNFYTYYIKLAPLRYKVDLINA